MSYYSFLWKSIKWWKKLCIHLLNVLFLNVHVLNSKYGCKKLDHQAYMEYIANYLITEGSVNCSLKRPLVWCHSAQNDTQGVVAMPMDLHLPQLIPRTDGSKRKPSRPCFACNGSRSDILAKRIPKRCTGIWCGTCKKPQCITPCFKIFTLKKTTKQYFWHRDFQHKEMSSYKTPLVQYNATNNKFVAFIAFHHDHDK